MKICLYGNKQRKETSYPSKMIFQTVRLNLQLEFFMVSRVSDDLVLVGIILKSIKRNIWLLK